jgi:hypothetical protein
MTETTRDGANVDPGAPGTFEDALRELIIRGWTWFYNGTIRDGSEYQTMSILRFNQITGTNDTLATVWAFGPDARLIDPGAMMWEAIRMADAS